MEISSNISRSSHDNQAGSSYIAIAVLYKGNGIKHHCPIKWYVRVWASHQIQLALYTHQKAKKALPWKNFWVSASLARSAMNLNMTSNVRCRTIFWGPNRICFSDCILLCSNFSWRSTVIQGLLPSQRSLVLEVVGRLILDMMPGSSQATANNL